VAWAPVRSGDGTIRLENEDLPARGIGLHIGRRVDGRVDGRVGSVGSVDRIACVAQAATLRLSGFPSGWEESDTNQSDPNRPRLNRPDDTSDSSQPDPNQ
jgi:hypothetical protein